MPAPAAFQLRPATEADVPVILTFIRALAEFEKLTHEFTATEEQLRTHLFREPSRAEVVLACEGKTAVGFALFFHNFSTFLAKPGLYLEDVFVLPEHRGKGCGRALLIHLAKLAVERGCGRFEWAVLDWNQPAIDFYGSLGAEPLNEWTGQRVTGPALTALASRPLF